MLTEIGKLLRKLRIDKNERMLDMAGKLDVSSSFLSAVEIGKKSPPSNFDSLVSKAYNLQGSAYDALVTAVDRSRKSFVLEPDTDLGRDTAGLLARKMESLSADQFMSIQEILNDDEAEE